MPRKSKKRMLLDGLGSELQQRRMGDYEFFDEIDEDDEEEDDALYDFAMELRHSRYSEREPYRARGEEDLCTRMLFGIFKSGSNRPSSN